jgi:hypothetical protein
VPLADLQFFQGPDDAPLAAGAAVTILQISANPVGSTPVYIDNLRILVRR